METIKFRAWDSYSNKIYEWNEIIEMDSKGYLTLSNLLNGLIDHIKPIQFTGLKDKNGKEIYEGDIVNIKSLYETDNPMDCNAVILFREGRFTTDFHNLQVCGFTKNDNWEGEVIGNIYENPEILKDAKAKE